MEISLFEADVNQGNFLHSNRTQWTIQIYKVYNGY